MKNRQTYAVAMVAALLSACAGYQFGDGTTALFELRQAYCTAAPGSIKDSLHERIRTEYPDYPETSMCDGLGFAVDIITPTE